MNNKLALKGSAWNVLGMALPLLAGIYCVPEILKILGPGAAGVLMLIWGVIGYFSIFDFGLGRAITQRMASYYSNNQYEKAADAGFTGLIMLFAVGALSGLMMMMAAPYITSSWNAEGAIDLDSLKESLQYVSWTLPMVVFTAGLRGVIESKNKFFEANLIRLPLGIWTFVTPVIVLRYNGKFEDVILVLMLGRLIATLCYSYLACELIRAGSFKKEEALFMSSFGGWMTISNVVSPIMTQLDRFVVAALLSSTMVAYLVTPYEIVMRLQLIATAVTSAYLPRLVALQFEVKKDRNKTYEQLGRLVYWPTVIFGGIAYLCAYEIMSLWVGFEFAQESAPVMKILIVGVVFNSQALIPYTLLQAISKPKLIAINHMVELIFYLLILWYMTLSYGIIGAALASSIRVIVDYFLLSWQVKNVGFLEVGVKKFKEQLNIVFAISCFVSIDYIVADIKIKLAIVLVVILSCIVINYKKIIKIAKPVGKSA